MASQSGPDDNPVVVIQKKHSTMKKWRCHDIRHSFAFNFLKRGRDVFALKAILGHQSIEDTVDLYGNFTAEHVERVPIRSLTLQSLPPGYLWPVRTPDLNF